MIDILVSVSMTQVRVCLKVYSMRTANNVMSLRLMSVTRRSSMPLKTL